MISYTHERYRKYWKCGPCVFAYIHNSRRNVYHGGEWMKMLEENTCNLEKEQFKTHPWDTALKKRCSSLAFSSSSTTKKHIFLQPLWHFFAPYFTAPPPSSLPPSSKSKTTVTANVNLHSALSNSILTFDEAIRQAQCSMASSIFFEEERKKMNWKLKREENNEKNSLT